MKKEMLSYIKEMLKGAKSNSRNFLEDVKGLNANDPIYNARLGNWTAHGHAYIIYKDGTVADVFEDDILEGIVNLPKLTGVAYAWYGSDWDELDTESGDLSGKFAGEDEWDFDGADAARDLYETSIEVKYGTDQIRLQLQAMF